MDSAREDNYLNEIPDSIFDKIERPGEKPFSLHLILSVSFRALATVNIYELGYFLYFHPKIRLMYAIEFIKDAFVLLMGIPLDLFELVSHSIEVLVILATGLGHVTAIDWPDHLPEPANAIGQGSYVFFELWIELFDRLDHFSEALVHLVHLLGELFFIGGVKSVVSGELVFVLELVGIGNYAHYCVLWKGYNLILSENIKPW